MLNLKMLVAGLAILGLSACETATPYKAAGNGNYGFSSQQIESNRARVEFAGNSLTDQQTVETYLLFRAAEMTAQSGHDYFRVVQRSTDERTQTIPTGFSHTPYYSHFNCNYHFYDARLSDPHGFAYRSNRRWASRWHDPIYGYGQTAYSSREITRYTATAEILMGHGTKPNDPAFFDARDVIHHLGPQIVLPEA